MMMDHKMESMVSVVPHVRAPVASLAVTVR